MLNGCMPVNNLQYNSKNIPEIITKCDDDKDLIDCAVH